ncbi:ergosterol biosynthesis ERG4/ERG24 family protein [Mycobacterium xenopi 4042]|uniref:Ergosterol biosynthesis ERG4/ERG24 family protein n=1 Tax=Mycobacterium xenopi 4042 TaxID=1299334 RepID=X8DJ27_MYCXE|nr:ergosterol biosynthesis ERG4/ERG24 family protein [Mycobacterium xenopi 4042]
MCRTMRKIGESHSQNAGVRRCRACCVRPVAVFGSRHIRLLAGLGFSGGVCAFDLDPGHLPAEDESRCASTTDAGWPAAEIRKMQKAVMGGLWLSLAALLIVSTLGHRFGWALVPTPICLLGDLFVAVGLGVAILVIIQNNYAAATVRVEANQKLISTGLYGFVRHPMYTGNVVVMIGIPLALGSYWGLVFVLPGVLALVLRIRDEEKLLRDELDGYPEYAQKVRYRLVPGMW